ncbi:cysteine dioxygenase [Streptomyces marincola]|uniref:Cysteine dioxygenase n=1 Tax=Streptomyces marincola TaxID=2878388 RepID=A0A1W7CTH4_9ACTN|nr:cysteine dioxygenase family protein [Streptomyces marincola]ARQ68016.1 cysteine dioxygenase [Streptomyces marincola]
MSAPAPAVAPGTGLPAPLGPQVLARIVRRFAARPEEWRPRVAFTSPDRFHLRLARTAAYEVWLLTWLPGQGTEIHDHGGSAGAFGVVGGALTEQTFPASGSRETGLTAGDVRAFGTRYVHRVVNASSAPAVSIHAYAPALTTQTYYRWLDGDGRLAVLRTDAVTG